MKQDIIEKIRAIIPEKRVIVNEPMAKHITFRVGGAALVFVELETKDEIKKVVSLLKKEGEDYYILGNGSNLLVSDMGFQGIVLHLSNKFGKIESDGIRLYCEAGASLASIARLALDNSLTGFEFAAGIPGSLGGAIVMNAGAYGGEMKQVVKKVTLLSQNGEEIEKTVDEMQFSYRHSILKEEELIVLEVELELQKGNKEEIKALMEELREKRVSKQPLEYPSAGSTFKRPEGYFAGKLIEDSGLKGYSVGGAQVSEKHSGFVINKDNATATDIYQLILDVQKKVKNDTGVTLEPEVIMLGKF